MALTSRQIAEAALELTEMHGVEALTMKRLATELGCRPSSLYNHISGRDDLIERMRGLIVEKIDLSAFATERWDVAVMTWARSYMAAFAARPSAIRLLATTAISDPAALRHYDTIVSALVSAGWAEKEVIAIVRTVEAHVLGSTLDVIAPSSLLSVEVVPNELVELKRALSPAYAATTSAQAAFDIGLSALIEGLRARLAAQDAPASAG